MDAIENAGRHPATVYRASTVYTTLSPCAMCSGAVLLYGILKVVVGENQTFMGEEALLRSRGVEVEVLKNPTCRELMRGFIAANSALRHEDIGVIYLANVPGYRPNAARSAATVSLQAARSAASLYSRWWP